MFTIVRDFITSLGGKSVTVVSWAPLGQYSRRESGFQGSCTGYATELPSSEFCNKYL